MKRVLHVGCGVVAGGVGTVLLLLVAAVARREWLLSQMAGAEDEQW